MFPWSFQTTHKCTSIVLAAMFLQIYGCGIRHNNHLLRAERQHRARGEETHRIWTRKKFFVYTQPFVLDALTALTLSFGRVKALLKEQQKAV